MDAKPPLDSTVLSIVVPSGVVILKVTTKLGPSFLSRTHSSVCVSVDCCQLLSEATAANGKNDAASNSAHV